MLLRFNQNYRKMSRAGIFVKDLSTLMITVLKEVLNFDFLRNFFSIQKCILKYFFECMINPSTPPSRCWYWCMHWIVNFWTYHNIGKSSFPTLKKFVLWICKFMPYYYNGELEWNDFITVKFFMRQGKGKQITLIDMQDINGSE